jgi:hypothetical protein
MKKTIIIIFLVVVGSIGFLTYDWHKKTTILKDDQRVTLYSWTDQEGAKHFTDTQPPDDARHVEMLKGYKYVDQPLVVKIKHKIIDAHQWFKKKLFKKKDRKKKKRSTLDRN